MFYAQQARRILDRIVGYKISPLLKSIPDIKTNSLGAGRVQSVVVRLIVDKEEEIKTFLDSSTSSIYVITGEFTINNCKLIGKYYKLPINQTEINQIVSDIKQDPIFILNNIETKTRYKQPPQPFITSSLQQEASYKLKFQLKKTMVIAQKLYEKGLITYMRTDSPTLSNDALSNIKKLILDTPTLGPLYYQYRQFKSKNSNAQEAHEAIRPTNFNINNLSNYELTDTDEEKLYILIYNRTLSTQIKPAEYSDTNLQISNTLKQSFNLSKSVLVFDGYLKLYIDTDLELNDTDADTNNDINIDINQLTNNQISWQKIIFNEKFKDAPIRYNEPSLVNKLESLGIGRPSTYASIISKIQEHKYVSISNIDGIQKNIINYILNYDGLKLQKKTTIQKIGYEKSKLIPTSDGILVNKYLMDNFSQIIQYKFTSDMETLLDEIANGTKIWHEVLKEFYQILSVQLDKIPITCGFINIGDHPKYGKITYCETKYGPTFRISKGKKDIFVKTDKITKTDDDVCKLAISLIDYKINK
jgi:DNA topoisomerase-1